MSGFIPSVKKVFFSKDYANFKDRASRSEYWFALLGWLLIQTFVALAFIIIMHATPRGSKGILSFLTITYIASLFYFIIPMWSVSWRRMHDLNKSGLWLLLNFIPYANVLISLVFIVLFCLKGTDGPNRFGPATEDKTPKNDSYININEKTDFTQAQ